MNKLLMYLIIGLVIFFILYFIYKKNFKNMKVPSVCLVTGGVKTGKSLLTVRLAIKDYRHRHRVWWVRTRIFRKNDEEPLFYTNTFITFGSKKRIDKKGKYHKLDKNIVLLDIEHLERKVRFNYGSVIYVCEASLLSDSQDFQNPKRNAELSLYHKLIAHETRGGVLYLDTQAILDLHYSEKRVLSNYFYIQKNINLWLFRILYLREMISHDIGENNFNEDVDLTMRKVLIGRWWYKKYDRYYYSYLTDDLSKKNEKVPFYVGELNSFNPLYRKLSLKKGENNEKTQEINENIEC